MSHAEIMDKRYQKRKKKEKTYQGFVGDRHYHLKEYRKLTDNEEVSKKGAARSIMDIVEEIKDEGMNDKRYLDIMDQLMLLNNEEEKIENIPVDRLGERGVSSHRFLHYETPADISNWHIGRLETISSTVGRYYSPALRPSLGINNSILSLRSGE
jgi:hypothetical protein